MNTDDVTKRLINEIQEEILSNETRLPPEVELARRLGVSRNAIRESLARLEREGLVTRKQGIGTLINRHVFFAETRLDLNSELIPTLERTGKKAETAYIHFQRIVAEGEIAESLQLKPAKEVFAAERLICADGSPAIYCIDYIPVDIVKEETLTEADFQPSVFAFLKKFCGTEVTMNLAELRAVPATGKTSASLWLPEGAPVLRLSEVGYSLMGEPVLYSEEFFKDREIRHMILRKKI